jgi:hypothetical protein
VVYCCIYFGLQIIIYISLRLVISPFKNKAHFRSSLILSDWRVCWALSFPNFLFYVYGLSLMTCSSSELFQQLWLLFGFPWNSLDVGSPRHKACTYTGEHITERRGQTSMPWARFEHTIPRLKGAGSAIGFCALCCISWYDRQSAEELGEGAQCYKP